MCPRMPAHAFYSPPTTPDWIARETPCANSTWPLPYAQTNHRYSTTPLAFTAAWEKRQKPWRLCAKPGKRVPETLSGLVATPISPLSMATRSLNACTRRPSLHRPESIARVRSLQLSPVAFNFTAGKQAVRAKFLPHTDLSPSIEGRKLKSQGNVLLLKSGSCIGVEIFQHPH